MQQHDISEVEKMSFWNYFCKVVVRALINHYESKADGRCHQWTDSQELEPTCYSRPQTRSERSAVESPTDRVARYQAVRDQSVKLCDPLHIEDYQLQSMPDCSPPKWHLAHSTWFYETFLLKAFQPEYEVVNPAYNFLFNSYYDSQGERWPRPARGLLSRPSVAEVYRLSPCRRSTYDEVPAECFTKSMD